MMLINSLFYSHFISGSVVFDNKILIQYRTKKGESIMMYFYFES